MGHLSTLILMAAWCGPVMGYEPPPPAITEAGADLIIRFEIGSRRTYETKYLHPICPACNDTASGPTWGIGYDAGHQPPYAILEDWVFHKDVDKMVAASGFKGKAAIPVVAGMQDVTVQWPDAVTVFRSSTMVKYRSIARRTFGEKFEFLPAVTQDSLVSLVYNRGGSKTGRSRFEIAVIADTCVPALDIECIAKNLEAMDRVWKNSSIEAGMKKRRYAEAELARRGL